MREGRGRKGKKRADTAISCHKYSILNTEGKFVFLNIKFNCMTTTRAHRAHYLAR